MNSEKGKLRAKFSIIVGIITVVFAAGTFFLTRSDLSSLRTSTVAGLALIKTMVKQSVPYDVALNNNKPTLIEFYADWCTTCQSMAPILNKLQQQYGETVNWVMLNIDDPQWAKPIEKYRVTGVPQFTFLDSNQQETEILVGKIPETIISKVLQELLS
ncbi:MAG: thioredoxin fold domain-containing protein [Moorea sp. SIO1G6]|uniref:thioredoxin domain-containing protein n=1 Tax=Moorena sp. SIO1G6 TaxID=2607840 RepID=UPI0013BFED0E|nr:thioredoxin domain-containing protein [Moorena sp. SIO1G6]NET63004.1 thioredoxin fold domain-containing protein [Moorena sp. SIO1G6]